MIMKIPDKDFFHRDVLDVAPDLVGKIIARRVDHDMIIRLRITETEAYRGEEDTACHAHGGMTSRNKMLYGEAGILYVYLCYGVHWLMNVVTGEPDFPQAVLFRACEEFGGPGKLTKRLAVDKSFNGEPLYGNSRIWIEDDGFRPEIGKKPRIGIHYAEPEDRDALWRFVSANCQ
jgi:DNA-3-methyladenine glycosylase